jgi:hypothetical protein
MKSRQRESRCGPWKNLAGPDRESKRKRQKKTSRQKNGTPDKGDLAEESDAECERKLKLRERTIPVPGKEVGVEGVEGEEVKEEKTRTPAGEGGCFCCRLTGK